MHHVSARDWIRLVCVGEVDGHIECLVGDLPEQCTGGLYRMYIVVSRGFYGRIQVYRLTPKPGVSIPTVTMGFENT